MSLSSDGQNLSADQISSTYLNSRLRYDYFLEFYFRFRSRPFHRNRCVILHRSAFQIGPPIAEIWRDIDFQDGGRQPCCVCFGVMADHPRSAFRGLNSVLKSIVGRINSSGDIAMYRFWRFGLKLPIHPPFWGVLGHRRDPQNDCPWAETRPLKHLA